jgi:hypothetical protein
MPMRGGKAACCPVFSSAQRGAGHAVSRGRPNRAGRGSRGEMWLHLTEGGQFRARNLNLSWISGVKGTIPAVVGYRNGP